MAEQSLRRSPALATEILKGVAFGLALGIFTAGAAALRLVFAGQGTPWREVLRLYGVAVAFYLGAGVLGGMLYGILAPIRHLYLGKCLTAYLILLLVYAGGSAVVLPLVGEPRPDHVIFTIWAILCLFLAPLYVWLLKE